MGDMEEMQKDKVYGRDILKPETLHSSRVNLATLPLPSGAG